MVLDPEANVDALNHQQRLIFNDILDELQHLQDPKPRMYYVDGPAGTGKTRLYNTIISTLHGQGHKVKFIESITFNPSTNFITTQNVCHALISHNLR